MIVEWLRIPCQPSGPRPDNAGRSTAVPLRDRPKRSPRRPTCRANAEEPKGQRREDPALRCRRDPRPNGREAASLDAPIHRTCWLPMPRDAAGPSEEPCDQPPAGWRAQPARRRKRRSGKVEPSCSPPTAQGVRRAFFAPTYLSGRAPAPRGLGGRADCDTGRGRRIGCVSACAIAAVGRSGPRRVSKSGFCSEHGGSRRVTSDR
jgi:hypothetical protein